MERMKFAPLWVPTSNLVLPSTESSATFAMFTKVAWSTASRPETSKLTIAGDSGRYNATPDRNATRHTSGETPDGGGAITGAAGGGVEGGGSDGPEIEGTGVFPQALAKDASRSATTKLRSSMACTFPRN